MSRALMSECKVFSFTQQIMKDRWMNVGHEEEELKPYAEPEADFSDTKRIGTCRRTSSCLHM